MIYIYRSKTVMKNTCKKLVTDIKRNYDLNSFFFHVNHNGLFVRENRLNKQRRIEKTTIEASQPPNTSPT